MKAKYAGTWSDIDRENMYFKMPEPHPLAGWIHVYQYFKKVGGVWIRAFNTPIPSNMIVFYRNGGNGTLLTQLDNYYITSTDATSMVEVSGIDAEHDGEMHNGGIQSLLAKSNSRVDSGGFYLPITQSSHTHLISSYHYHTGITIPRPLTHHLKPYQTTNNIIDTGGIIFQSLEEMTAFFDLYADAHNYYIRMTTLDDKANEGSAGHTHDEGYTNWSNKWYGSTASGGGSSTYYRGHQHQGTHHTHPMEDHDQSYKEVRLLEANQQVQYLEDLPRGSICCFTDDNIPFGFTRYNLDSNERTLKGTTGSPGLQAGSNSSNMPEMSLTSGAAASHSDSRKYKGGSGRYVPQTSHTHTMSSHGHPDKLSNLMKRYGLVMARKAY
jgi:hypothetical protein